MRDSRTIDKAMRLARRPDSWDFCCALRPVTPGLLDRSTIACSQGAGLRSLKPSEDHESDARHREAG